MPDNNPVKSKRDTALERMRTKYPDRSFDDDEAIFGQINEDYEDYDKRLNDYGEREKAFSDMFLKDKRSARIVMDWKNGVDPIANLIRLYGKDELSAAIEDPERLQAIEDANKEWADNVAKSEEYEKEYDKNLPESLKNLEEWAQKNGRSDDEVDEVMNSLAQISKDFIMGIFKTETLDMISKALNYDTATEEARMEGEVAGRNAKIDEKLRKGKRGDGTPQLDGKSGGTEGKPKRDLGALDRYDGTDANIWERGNEKRIARR